MEEVVLCAHCTDEVPATHFTAPKDAEDPCCDLHFSEKYDTCPRCGAVRDKHDAVYIRVARATRLDPEEYDEACVGCVGPIEEDGEPPERDPDDYY